jgi:topoisomerase IA-like protein
VFAPKRSAAPADKILESEESSAHNKNHQQMTTAERTQTFSLDSEISNAITKSQSKDRERNKNENEELFCERDEELDPLGIDPERGKMLVNPLWTADQVN